MAVSPTEFQPFQSCADVDGFFREGRSYFSELFVEKFPINSIYYGRLDTQSWPVNTSPTQTGFRFQRGYYDPTLPYQEVVSQRCEQNQCESNFETIIHPGTDSYTWTLMMKDMRTQFYCISDWLNRLFPMEEIQHIMKTNIIITNNVHEEFGRANFVGASGHKWAGVASDSSLVSCAPIKDDMWIMKTYQGVGEIGYDTRYIYVNLPADQLKNISLLALDNLDDALIDLQRESDAYRLDVSEMAGRPLLEIIVPDSRVLRNIWQYAKQSGGWWEAQTDFSDNMLKFSLGIERVIGNYAFCFDVNGLHYNVDWAYNAGLGAFSSSDVDTWPRLVRVLPYKVVPAELGCKYIVNPEFNRTDFAITVAWVNNALTKWVAPNFTGYGEAQAFPQNYAGEWEWKNPDWECNIKRNQGFFWNQFKMSMQIKDPTIMHSFLHRLNNSRLLPGACCDLNSYEAPPSPIDCYNCEVLGQSE